MKFSISEAAKHAGVSRSCLYRKYIQTGLLTVGVDQLGKKVIDSSEIIRVFGHIHNVTDKDSVSTPNKDNTGQSDTQHEDVVTQNLLLTQEIASLKDQLRQYQAREQWFQDHLKEVTSHNKLLIGSQTKKRFWFTKNEG